MVARSVGARSLTAPFFGRPVTNLPPQGRGNGLGSPGRRWGRALKKRLALAFVALSLTPAASPAGDLAVAPLYRPVPFVPRQTVEWTGLYLGVNAGYGWGPTSTNASFEGDPGAGTQFGALGPNGFVSGLFTTPQGLGATELSTTSLGGSGKLSGA